MLTSGNSTFTSGTSTTTSTDNFLRRIDTIHYKGSAWVPAFSSTDASDRTLYLAHHLIGTILITDDNVVAFARLLICDPYVQIRGNAKYCKKEKTLSKC